MRFFGVGLLLLGCHTNTPRPVEPRLDAAPHVVPQVATPEPKNNVTVSVNFGVLRAHGLGPRLQRIFGAPDGLSIDPARDIDWMLITGPSLLETTRDAMVIHYSAPDADVEQMIASRAGNESFEVGVDGVKAWRGQVHGAERAFLRGPPHCISIVPLEHAAAFARAVSQQPCVLRAAPGEAMRARFMHPAGSVKQLPQSISELRIWIVARSSDDGADLLGSFAFARSAHRERQYVRGEPRSPRFARPIRSTRGWSDGEDAPRRDEGAGRRGARSHGKAAGGSQIGSQ